MKKLVRALILLITSWLVMNCVNEDQMPFKGKVQFAVAPVAESSSGGRIMSHPFPDGAYISVSIETATGTSVYSLERIDLIQLGSGYVTVPLALIEGSYRVTDFFVMSEGGNVLYATPKEGSPLAGLVADPLPINFNIAADGILNLQVQVVDVDQQSPEDFGYVSFGVEVVGSDYAVSLFIGEGDDLSFACGKLELYQGNELVYTQDLEAKINTVNFKGDPDATYTLLVKKEGYTIKTLEYILQELIEELDGKPLVMVLSPAVTISLTIRYPSSIVFLIVTETETVTVTVDWGDGVVEQSLLPVGHWIGPGHMYENVGSYHINMTGDLSGIKGFYVASSDSESKQRIDAIDITQLSELTHFDLTWRDGPEEINFTNNSKLEVLFVHHSYLSSLDISNMPMLKNLDISANRISDANVNEIVNHLYNNATSNNLYGGYFTYTNGSIISDESRSKLISLRDNYGWRIDPNPQ